MLSSFVILCRWLGIGCTITAISQVLNHGGKPGPLEPHFLCGSLNIAILGHMNIIDSKGGTYKYPHHKQILFNFLNLSCTTIDNKSNWFCDGADGAR